MFDYLRLNIREPLRAPLPAEKLCPVMRLIPASEEIDTEVSKALSGNHVLDVLEHIYVTIFEHPLPGYCPYPTLTAGKNQAVMNSALRMLSNDKDDYVRAFANSVLAAFKSMKSFHDFKLPVNETKTVINRLNLTAIVRHPIILDAIFAVYGDTKTSYNTSDDKYLPVPNMFKDVSRITIPYSDINTGNRALPPYWRLVQGIVSNIPKDASYEDLVPIYGDLMTLLAYSARPLSPLIMLDTRRDCGITYSILNVLAAELIGSVSGITKSVKNSRRAYELFLPCYGSVGDGAFAAEALAPLLSVIFNGSDSRFLSILMDTHKNEGRYFYGCYGILELLVMHTERSHPARSIAWDVLDEPITVVALEAAKSKSNKKSTKGKKKASGKDDLDLESLDEPEVDEGDTDDSELDDDNFELDMEEADLEDDADEEDADIDADGEDNDEDDIEGDPSEDGETDFDPDLDGDDDMPEDNESSDDDLSEDDGSDDTTSIGDDPDTSTGLTMEDEGEDTPDDESNTIDDPFTDEGSEDSSEDPTAEGDDDLSSDDLQEGSEGDLDGEGELADDGTSDDAMQGDPTDNSIAPPAPAHNDIGPISLDRSKEGLGTYLYKRSLLAACIKLLKSEDHGLTPEQVSYLEEWCVRWLFIASVKETKAVVKSLGLTSVLR